MKSIDGSISMKKDIQPPYPITLSKDHEYQRCWPFVECRRDVAHVSRQMSRSKDSALRRLIIIDPSIPCSIMMGHFTTPSTYATYGLTLGTKGACTYLLQIETRCSSLTGMPVRWNMEIFTCVFTYEDDQQGLASSTRVDAHPGLGSSAGRVAWSGAALDWEWSRICWRAQRYISFTLLGHFSFSYFQYYVE